MNDKAQFERHSQFQTECLRLRYHIKNDRRPVKSTPTCKRKQGLTAHRGTTNPLNRNVQGIFSTITNKITTVDYSTVPSFGIPATRHWVQATISILLTLFIFIIVARNFVIVVCQVRRTVPNKQPLQINDQFQHSSRTFRS